MKLNSYLKRNRHGVYCLRIQRDGSDRSISLRTKDFAVASAHAYVFGARIAAMKNQNPISSFELNYDGKNIALKTEDNDADRAAGQAALLALLQATSNPAPPATPQPLQNIPILKKVALRDAVLEFNLTLDVALNGEVAGGKNSKTAHKKFSMQKKVMRDLVDFFGADFDMSNFDEIAIEDTYIQNRLDFVERSTVKRELTTIKAFTDWCANRRRMYIPASFSVKFDAKNVHRDPFDYSDLSHLFRELPAHADQPFKFWILVLGLFTGARISEIASISIEAVYQSGGSCAVFLAGTKTDSSPRHIPIHETIVDLGLIDYVNHRRDLGYEMLFDLPTGSSNGLGAKPSKFFSKYKIAVGITSKNKVFHSFRTTIVDVLKQALVNDEARKEYVGHSTGEDVHNKIYSRNPIKLKTIKEVVVDKIDFDQYFFDESVTRAKLLDLKTLKLHADKLLESEVIKDAVKKELALNTSA